MGMPAGRLRRIFRAEVKSMGKDAGGQPLDVWTPVVTFRGDIRGQTGMGSIRQSSLQAGTVPASVNSYSIRARFREDVDAGMRLVELRNGVPVGDPYDIKQVRHDYAGRVWTDFVCEQGGNNG